MSNSRLAGIFRFAFLFCLGWSLMDVFKFYQGQAESRTIFLDMIVFVAIGIIYRTFRRRAEKEAQQNEPKG